MAGPLKDYQLVMPGPTRALYGGNAIVVAPAAGAVIADSGPLPAGEYMMEIAMASDDAAALGKYVAFEHRNAANLANVQTFILPTPGAIFFRLSRIIIQANERVRAVAGTTAGAAGASYNAMINLYPLP